MRQTTALVKALKRVLKARNITYRMLAERLGLSEASVKRTFSEQTFSLSRLEAICDAVDVNFLELAKMSEIRDSDFTDELTLDQERELASNTNLLSCFFLLLVGWRTLRIARRLELDQTQVIQLLAKLDRLRLIELLPRNRVRLLTSRQIKWRPDGPVRRRYEKQVKTQFLSDRFSGKDKLFRFESGELSEASARHVLRRMEALSKEFAELAEIDLALPPDEKRSVGLMLALRPWTYWDVVGK